MEYVFLVFVAISLLVAIFGKPLESHHAIVELDGGFAYSAFVCKGSHHLAEFRESVRHLLLSNTSISRKAAREMSERLSIHFLYMSPVFSDKGRVYRVSSKPSGSFLATVGFLGG